jgi:1,4-dihydroxy-2-naphthoate octaprenyltransferase
MLRATLLVFALALLVAFPLMLRAGLWSFPLAALCVALGILYTGGPRPLGYVGLGELLVLLFFGPVATCGTYFLQTSTLTLPVFIASLAPGLLSCAIIIANNLRDETTDRVAGKQTLIVRYGRTFGSWEYTSALLAAALVPLVLIYFHGAPINLACASLLFFVAIPLVKTAFYFEDPMELIPVLQKTALLLFLYTAVFCWSWYS